MSREDQNIARILREIGGRDDTRLFRNNVGTAWVTPLKPIKMDGGIFLPKGRPYAFGLGEGTHDCIGVKKVLITPDMVGQAVGVFTSIEVKSSTGRMTKGQKDFQFMVESMGGFSGMARTVEDAETIIGV